MIVIAIWALLATGAVIYMYRRDKKKWKTADRLLDGVLSGSTIDVSDLEEGGLSLFADRTVRIQEKLQTEVWKAENEKEQVKQLISNMSHQLKTPLANVMMYVQLLEAGGLSDGECAEFIRKLKLHSERMDWILNSLFKMIKLEDDVIQFEAEGRFIKETLQQAVSAVYEKAQKKGIEVITEDFTDIRLWHNRKWTCEVFENILENAVKYSHADGRIYITVEPLELYTGIQISDHGIGIREEELTQIFQRFYRSTQVQDVEGSGIGLYLAKMILEKEKGYMTVSSEYGKGSSFMVYLRNV